MVTNDKEQTLAKMDAASLDARKEFTEMRANTDKATFESIHGLIAQWWERWYPTAGHKRLAWILMNEA